MTVLWLVEASQSTPSPIATLIMGEFPIRVFASIESIIKIKKLRPTERPSAVLIHSQSLTNQSMKALHLSYPKIPKVILHFEHKPVPSIEYPPYYGVAVFFVPEKIHAFDLCQGLHKIVSTFRKDPGLDEVHHQVSFRDITFSSQSATIAGKYCHQEIQLSTKESRILEYLIKSQGQCLSREDLQQKIWPKTKVASRTLDSHISRLRKHLQVFGIEIENTYGNGYTLK